MVTPMQDMNPRQEQVAIDSLDPNPWNPNRMNKKMLAKLRRVLDEYGAVANVIVRPHPETPGRFQIIDGFHRWSVQKERGEDMIGVTILDADDRAAKKLTVILNETHGDAEPELLGRLFADLAKDSIDDLVTDMPYDESEIRLLLDLSAHAWDPDAKNLGGARGTATDDWATIKVRVPKGAQKVIEKALAQAAGEVKAPLDVKRGIALERMAADFLAGPAEPLVTGAEPGQEP